MDQACLFQTISQAPWAIPVYSGRDESTVFSLVGPGTPRADLAVAANVAVPSSAVTTLAKPAMVAEVSVELNGLAPDAALELRNRHGRWQRIPTIATGGSAHLLHAELSDPIEATAVRAVDADDATLQHVVVLVAPA